MHEADQPGADAAPRAPVDKRPECCSNPSHYVRQIDISRRRQASRIVWDWLRNRNLTTSRRPWTR